MCVFFISVSQNSAFPEFCIEGILHCRVTKCCFEEELCSKISQLGFAAKSDRKVSPEDFAAKFYGKISRRNFAEFEKCRGFAENAIAGFLMQRSLFLVTRSDTRKQEPILAVRCAGNAFSNRRKGPTDGRTHPLIEMRRRI